MGGISGKGGSSSSAGIPIAGLGATSEAQNKLGLEETGQAWDRLAEFQPKFEDTIWPYAQDFMDDQAQSAHAAIDFSKQLSDVYTGEFLPVTRQFVQNASTYDSPARQDYEAGRAAQGAAAAGTSALENAKRNLFSYGIDPSAGAYAGTQVASNLSNATMISLAADAARRGVHETGMQAQLEAAKLGQAIPTSFANVANVGGNLRASGLTGGTQALTTGANVLGTPLGWADAAGRSFSGAGGTMASQAQAAAGINAANAAKEKDFSQGIGSILGTGAKIATAFI